MLFDLDAADRHINDLAGDSESIACWQIFDDLKARKDQRRARCFHGRLDLVAGRLQQAQRDGCGIFAAINATDGRGRKAENTVAARTNFLDLDGTPLPENWRVEPDIIVNTSPGNFHCHWLLEPTDNWAMWIAMQKALAMHHGGDQKVALVTQVARVPGFYHLKDRKHPFAVRTIHRSFDPDLRWPIEELVRAFGFDLDAITLPPPRVATNDRPPAHGWDSPLDVAAAYLLVADEDQWATTSNGAVSIFKMGCRLRDLGISQGLATDLIEEHIPALPPEAEGNPHFIIRKVANAYRYAAGEAGSRSAEADRAELLAALEDEQQSLIEALENFDD